MTSPLGNDRELKQDRKTWFAGCLAWGWAVVQSFKTPMHVATGKSHLNPYHSLFLIFPHTNTHKLRARG